MIMDERTEFCDATALSTVGTGLAAVGNVIDMSVARDIGNSGKPLYLVIQITTAVTATGASTVSFQLVSDAQDPPAADATETLHWASAAIAKATLVAGYTLTVPLPLQDPAYERYLGIQQNVASNAVTAGAINAFLTLNPAKWTAHPDGVN